jgi:hypothetical protein
MIHKKLQMPSILFLENYWKSRLTSGSKRHAISFLKNAFPRNFPDFNITATTETEIKSIIHSLKAKYSTGYDGITSKILKACASLISHPLNHICNRSLLMGTFPNHLQILIVRPFHKKGENTNMSNYRPILLLTTFSKVIKNGMQNRISHYLRLIIF